MNETLRRVLFDAGLTEVKVAAHLGVLPKTVRRWLEGRLPCPRHRRPAAHLVGLDEDELWPKVRAPDRSIAPGGGDDVYPHRWSVSLDSWRSLFDAAEAEIDILVYGGLFLAEDSAVLRVLEQKAVSGVRIRIALSDPNSPQVAERRVEEGIADAMAAKIRNTLGLYQPLCAAAGVQLRLFCCSYGWLRVIR